jgi:hypothetical protein
LEKVFKNKASNTILLSDDRKSKRAIQQSNEKNKKTPPVTRTPRMPLQVQPPAAMLLQEVLPFQEPRRIADILDSKWNVITVDLLKQVILAERATWSEAKREKIGNNCQKQAYIVAHMEFIHSQLLSTYCNERNLAGQCERQAKWYKKAFPCCMISLSSREEEELPDPMYKSIKGTHIHLTRWDLNALGYAIPYLECKDGLLKKVPFHTAQIGRAMTPIFETYGPTGYKMGGYDEYTSIKNQVSIL